MIKLVKIKQFNFTLISIYLHLNTIHIIFNNI